MFAFYVIFGVLVLVLYMLTRPLSLSERVLSEKFMDMSTMDIASVTEAAKKAGSLSFPLTVSPKLAEAPAMSLEGMPTPPELFKKARELMAKYDQPDLWIHAARVMDKDPGQLARMNLGIE